MPSGLELKPTRLMPLTERSECREVLLLECGAPAREPPGQREPRAALGRAVRPVPRVCSGPPLLQVPTQRWAAGCPAWHVRGSEHAAPLQPGSAVHDLLPVPTTATNSCTSRHPPAAPVPVLTAAPPACPSTEHRVNGNPTGHAGGGPLPPVGPPELQPRSLEHRGKFWGTEAAKEDETAWI